MSGQKIAVIGLGSMGFGMAGSLLRAGHRVWGGDIAPGPVARLRAEGAEAAPPLAVAGELDALVLVVLNAAQTEAVLFGPEGIAPRMRAGAVVLSCATVPPAFARRMAARVAALGLHYLDAPISGEAAKAAAGKLTVMASGPKAAFTAARPALDAMAETVFPLGQEAGAGSAMKAVNQMLAGIHIAAMAEALTFGLTQGVAPATFLEVISKSAGTSWMLENRAPHVIAGDYSPKSCANIWPKDLGIVLEIAREAGFDAPLSEAALARFAEAAAQGLGDEDDAAVAKVYARAADLTLPGEEGAA